jgi:hypothetical protein
MCSRQYGDNALSTSTSTGALDQIPVDGLAAHTFDMGVFPAPEAPVGLEEE